MKGMPMVKKTVRNNLKNFALAAATATGLGGCTMNSDQPIHLLQGTVTFANGDTAPTNVFRQTDPGMGSSQVCLGDAAQDKQAVMVGCSTTVGPARGAVDATMNGLNTVANMGMASAYVKDAFVPIRSSSTTSEIVPMIPIPAAASSSGGSAPGF
jgi:hypothetical protein